jgi:hypothetical protein
MMVIELKYNLHNEVILVIILVVEEWSIYLEGAEQLILVFSDYKNQEYYITTKVLNCC